MNVAVITGRLSSTPRLRDLPSGATVANLEVTVPRSDEADESVPVAVFDPSELVATLAAGTEITVHGRIRRRFFRAGGATASRTEVVASSVIPSRRPAQVRRLRARVAEAVAPAGDDPT